MPIAISSFAVLFAVLSFWWMNWRPGKLNVGNFRMFAAGKGTEGSSDSKNLVIVTLPLTLWNSGARPLLIDDLRLHPKRKTALPELAFEAVDDKLTNSALERDGKIKRDYLFLPLALRANEVVRANCVFEARSDVTFLPQAYKLSLQARFMGSRRWKHMKDIELDFSTLDAMGLYGINELYSVFPYRVDEGREISSSVTRGA